MDPQTEPHPGMTDPEIQALMNAEQVMVGDRADTVLKVMNAAGHDGWSNHQILALGSTLLDKWGKYPSDSNLYEHWSRLLGMLRNVRSHYPNPDQLPGKGARP